MGRPGRALPAINMESVEEKGGGLEKTNGEATAFLQPSVRATQSHSLGPSMIRGPRCNRSAPSQQNTSMSAQPGGSFVRAGGVAANQGGVGLSASVANANNYYQLLNSAANPAAPGSSTIRKIDARAVSTNCAPASCTPPLLVRLLYPT